ncbi:MAG: hypothetical protein M3O46_05095, partial [Myxococcota bacterium]|nr:hypothetical protein [Myxococcota bacterium]
MSKQTRFGRKPGPRASWLPVVLLVGALAAGACSDTMAPAGRYTADAGQGADAELGSGDGGVPLPPSVQL